MKRRGKDDGQRQHKLTRCQLKMIRFRMNMFDEQGEGKRAGLGKGDEGWKTIERDRKRGRGREKNTSPLSASSHRKF